MSTSRGHFVNEVIIGVSILVIAALLVGDGSKIPTLFAFWRDGLSLETPDLNESKIPAVPPISPDNSGCPTNDLPHHQPVVGKTWDLPAGGWIVMNFWSNNSGVDQKEHKILLSPNEPRSFFGGGSAWQWPAHCEAIARTNFDGNPLPATTLEDLGSKNLISKSEQ